MENLNQQSNNFNDGLPSFIMSVSNDWAKMSIRHANCILGSKHNLYRLTAEEGFYLPKEESRAINTQYLFGVVQGKYFRIFRRDVKF